MRLLFIGDVVGKPGRKIIQRALPGLIKREKLDLVVANCENSAAGSGMTPDIYREMLAAGVDCITLGDHIYKRREILPTLEQQTNIVKPANFPARSPGREVAMVAARDGTKVAVISLLGRVFMRPVDCPWGAVDRVLAKLPSDVKVIFVDFHAEATSDKQVMGRYLDGRVSAVLGTHTHVPTADAQILPHGTAYQTDAGMTGDYDSVIGMDKEEPLRRFTRKTPGTRFEPADGDATLCGVAVETGADGLATRIAPVRIGGRLAPAMPAFWD